jgi:hypothetical protein
MSGTHQLLVCADKVNVLGRKIKCMLMFHHHNAGKNHNIKNTNEFFENMPEFKYLGNSSNKSKSYS